MGRTAHTATLLPSCRKKAKAKPALRLVPRQQYLDFGPAEHFRLLHGTHDKRVAVSLKAVSGSWHERTYPHHEACDAVLLAAGLADFNAYMSQAGFGERRITTQVRALPCAFVDLDYYKLPTLERLSPEELLERARDALPWLPQPTLLFASGRGAYFVWVFSEALPHEQLHAWQMVEDALVLALKPFGADPQARDATRVLRIAGSRHLGAQSIVAAQQVGPVIAFARLEQATRHAVNAPPIRPVPVIRRTLPELLPRREKAPARRLFGQRKSALRLAQTRMADYRRLAQLRGGRLHDGRARLLYAYAQAAAWFCSSLAQLEEELLAFAGEFFVATSRYGPRQVKTVLQRFMDDGEGKVVRLAATRGEGRYRFSNAYILRLLQITPEEQRHMATVISPEEKARRRRERDNAIPRDEYLAQAAQRRAHARRMRAGGESACAIAKTLGVTRDAVYRMLRESA